MKKRIDFFKYIIRAIGSLFILAATVILVFAPIIQIDGIKNKDLRELSTIIEEIIATEESWLLEVTESSSSAIAEDLEDNDLPYRKSGIKAWFRDLKEISKETLNENISLAEVFVIVWKMPGVVDDLENLMDTDRTLNEAIDILVDYDPDTFGKAYIQEKLESASEHFDTVRTGCYAVLAVFGLMSLLVVYAVIGNICNKGRGGKYVLLALSVAITAGCIIGLPMASQTLQDALSDSEMFSSIDLHVTIIPILATALLIIPAVLDRWNKKREKKAQAAEAMLQEEKPVIEIKQVQHSVTVPAEQVVNSSSAETEPQSAETESVSAEEPVATASVTAASIAATTAAVASSVAAGVTGKVKNCTWLKKVIHAIAGKKKIICILAAIAAVTAALVFGISLATNTYRAPVHALQKQANMKKFSSTYKRNQHMLNGLAKDEITEIINILEESDEYVDMMEELEDIFVDNLEDLQDEYGTNYKYTYKIIEKEELEKDDLRAFRDKLRSINESCEEFEEETEDYDSDDWEDLADSMDLTKSKAKALVRQIISIGKVCKKAKVTEGYELTVESKLTGSELDEPEEEEFTILVYKVDGRWISENSTYSLQSLLYF